MLKKIILSLLVSLLLLTSSLLPWVASPARAAWYDQGPLEFQQKVFDDSNNDIFGERYTYAQVTWILNSLLFVFIPQDLFKLAASFEVTSLNKFDLNKIAGLQGYAALGNILGFFYTNPPASGISWAKDSLQKFNIIPSAYAQQSPGFGFDALSVFRTLWTISRNIAYALLTVLILLIAFAVMFRAKINPQTVVTLQSSLPKIVSVMLLITFSYAIAGFLIDLMYLLFGFVVFAIEAFGGKNLAGWQGAGSYLSNFATGDVTSMLFSIFGNAWEGVSQVFQGNTLATILIIMVVVIILIVVALVLATGSLALIPLLPFILAFVGALVAFMMKFFIMMATTYLSLLFNVVAGPLIILFEAVPGNKSATMGWLRSLVADILIFLVVGLILFMTGIFISTMVNFEGNIWGPPYTGGSKHFLAGMIAFGSIMLLSNVRKVVYQFMQKRELELGIDQFRNVGQSFQRGVSELYDPDRRAGLRSRIGSASGGRTRASWARRQLLKIVPVAPPRSP